MLSDPRPTPRRAWVATISAKYGPRLPVHMPTPSEEPDPNEVQLHLDDDPEADVIDRVEQRAEQTMERGLDRFARLVHAHSRATARFLFPLTWLAAGALVLVLFHPAPPWRMWIFTTVYFAPLGLETGIPTGLSLGLPPWLMITIVIWVDIWGGLFLVWNLALLHRLPWLGHRILRLEEKTAKRWQRHRRIRDLGVLGLGLFVFIPVSGSGAVPAALIGRLGGFPWALVWLAIVVGSSLRVVAYTFLVIGLFDLFGVP